MFYEGMKLLCSIDFCHDVFGSPRNATGPCGASPLLFCAWTLEFWMAKQCCDGNERSWELPFPCQMESHWVLGYSRWYACVGRMCRWKIWKGVMGFLTTMLYDVIGFKWDLFFSDNFQCSHVNLFTFSRLWTANVTNYKMMQQSEGELSPRGLRYIRHRVGLGCQKSMKSEMGKWRIPLSWAKDCWRVLNTVPVNSFDLLDFNQFGFRCLLSQRLRN